MGYRKRDSRRKIELQDSSSDSEDSKMAQVRNATVRSDPKIALSMHDLGNASRNRTTAHDREQDKRINFAALDRSRKCNIEGTDEAGKAALNQASLTSWANFGGTDPTTNLDDIARGQYHREATAQKVRHEARQLQLAGKDPNAESVDSHSGPPPRRPAPLAVGRGDVRLQLSTTARSSRPLDPAVDPEREYIYKSKSKLPKRSKSTSQTGRISKNTQPRKTTAAAPKAANVNVHAAKKKDLQVLLGSNVSSRPLTEASTFMEWANRPSTQRSSVPTASTGTTAPATRPLTVPRSELVVKIPGTNNKHDDHDDHTDGRLSPVSMSTISDRQSQGRGQPFLKPRNEHDAALQQQPLSASTTSSAHSLLDADAPIIPLKALTPMVCRDPRPAQESSSPKNPQVVISQSAQKAAQEPGSTTARREGGANASFKFVDQAPSATSTEAFGSVEHSQSPSTSLSVDQRIVDVINPGFREHLLSVHGDLTQPLQSRPTNISSSKKDTSSKYAFTPSEVGTTAGSNMAVVKRVNSILSTVSSSLPGDTNFRHQKSAPSTITSKWASQSPSYNFKKVIAPGPGYAAAYKALEAADKLPASLPKSNGPTAGDSRLIFGAGAQEIAQSTSGLFRGRPTFNYEADEGEL